ncbi:MAG: hypothetical protein KGS72_28270 [Cyanobacteria bacterium REEB67]|nr:hypothetical protein [Cyanobacteria bacterium REEB67]
MERLDLLLITAFIPVFCLTFLIVIDTYATFVSRARSHAFQKFSASYVQSTASLKKAEEILRGRTHA